MGVQGKKRIRKDKIISNNEKSFVWKDVIY
jgi:hypothetical protein